MAEPFLGEIRIFSGTFAPTDWAFCDGSQLPLPQYQALFSVIGLTYGGDGTTYFVLPDLRGRVPMHFGVGTGLTPRPLGVPGGSPAVTLDWTQLPSHTHVPTGQAAIGGANSPVGAVWAETQQTGSPKASTPLYDAGPANVQMDTDALASTGAGAAHNNMQPYQGLNFIIALTGIYPPRP